MKPIIRIIAVGGLKDNCIWKAADFYTVKLRTAYNLSVVELPDEPAPDTLSAAGRQAVLESEGQRIGSRFKPSHIRVSLASEGRLADLSFFSDLIGRAHEENRGVDFIIGGSLGLADSILKQSDYRISLSGMTFPHRLTRLLLLEILGMVQDVNAQRKIFT